MDVASIHFLLEQVMIRRMTPTVLLDMDRNGNYEILNSGMFSARWNALRLGSASSDPGPEHGLPRHGIGQPWSNGDGETIHPLDKLEKKRWLRY